MFGCLWRKEDLLVKQSLFQRKLCRERRRIRSLSRRRRGKILDWYDSVVCSQIKLTCYLLCLFQFLFTTWQTPTHPVHHHLGLQTTSTILYNSSSHCELTCFSSASSCRILNLIIANITYLRLEPAIYLPPLCRLCLDHLPAEAAPLHPSVLAPGPVSLQSRCHCYVFSNKPDVFYSCLRSNNFNIYREKPI